MDPITEHSKVSYYFTKYKYVLLVVAVGILLMMIPPKEDLGESSELPQAVQHSQDIQEQLEQIISQIHGVGKAKVLLTQSEGQRILYETNEDRTNTHESTSSRVDTVIIMNDNRTEEGLVRQIIPPIYLGAVVVCQGGNKASVKLAVVEAVANATGLSSDRISVLKMK